MAKDIEISKEEFSVTKKQVYVRLTITKNEVDIQIHLPTTNKKTIQFYYQNRHLKYRKT